MYDFDFLKVNRKELERLFENYFTGNIYQIIIDDFKKIFEIKVLYENKEDLNTDINKTPKLNDKHSQTNMGYLEQFEDKLLYTYNLNYIQYIINETYNVELADLLYFNTDYNMDIVMFYIYKKPNKLKNIKSKKKVNKQELEDIIYNGIVIDDIEDDDTNIEEDDFTEIN